jgi:magnesium transporter
MSFKAYYLAGEGDLRRDISKEEARAAFESRQGLLWVDITDTQGEDGEFLERAFGFHHLAVEDCLSKRVHPPKIDDFGDYVFVIVHGIDHTVESDIVQTTEMALFLGSHFVVSNHSLRLHSVDSVRRLVEDDGRPLKRGADFLAHALIDSLIDNVLPTIDRMNEVAEDVQEEAIAKPQQSTLVAILKLKRSSLRIHRSIAPQREVVNRLARGEFPVIKEEAQVFYRDIYDHLVRIEDLNQTIRDEADNALETYLSSVAILQNETMKVLSAVASIFLPLTLVAGIYGMNFENMPELGWRWAYFGVIGFIGLATIISMWWFWHHGWIKFGPRQGTAPTNPFAVEPESLPGYDGHMPSTKDENPA